MWVVSILLINGWLTLDDLELRNKRLYRWAETGWVKLLDFLKEVSIFIKYTLGGPRTALTNHLVSAMDSEFNDNLGDDIALDQSSCDSKKLRGLELAILLWQEHRQPIQRPEPGQQVDSQPWFNAEYGNFVSAMLKRPIVVM